MEETLREAACLGNLLSVQKLLNNGADINSGNKMNGWTALHWACKRGHKIIVRHLLENGADVTLKTFNGETPATLATSPEILALLGAPNEESSQQRTSSQELPIIPHYLEHPPFPYSDMTLPDSTSPYKVHIHSSKDSSKETRSELKENQPTDVGLTVKVRVCGSGESDFVEVEIPALTYSALLRACCEELDISSTEVAKIRKLPNVLVRKDKDVQRMKEGQELELVLKTENSITSMLTVNPFSGSGSIPLLNLHPVSTGLARNETENSIIAAALANDVPTTSIHELGDQAGSSHTAHLHLNGLQ